MYGGNIARFYQGYKRIAQLLQIPGWDDPEASILELVRSWLSSTPIPYLLVIDNADNIEDWWPGKYKSAGPLDDPSKNLSRFLPDGLSSSHLLITTRDNRVAGRLASEGQPINLTPMSTREARSLFLSKQAGEKHNFSEEEISNIVEELDHLPLAISQAAAFIQENPVSIAKYINALRGKNAKEFLNEELNDSRRDDDSGNSVFRTWSVSFDQIKQQKPRAADLLSLMAMLDRQSVPHFLLKMPEAITSLGTLQAFNLVTVRDGSQSFQIHRLVQHFVQISLQRDGTTRIWQEAALASVSKNYPTEIGVAEWPKCDALAPHVHVLTGYSYPTAEARLDLAHLLCWAADFDIERGMYAQALDRAGRSLSIFQQLVPEDDERRAAATWLYGRLRYYQVQSARDIEVAADLLQKALDTSKYPSLNFAESAFELAHLYYDQCNGAKCLEMGKASFQCWEAMEGVNSSRTLDNMHDYALELAMLGHKEEGIAKWQEIVERSPTIVASEQTKTVYSFRSLAGIAEFQGNAAMAEIFYAKLIAIGEATYHSEHIHLFDYRLSHAEQIMRQGRLEEAMALSEAILTNCKDSSEWRISANCLQLIAECYRLKASYNTEHEHRVKVWEMHEKKLGRRHRETMNAAEALADCYLNSCKYLEAENTYEQVVSWRNDKLGLRHPDTVRAIECIGICHAGRQRHAEAEASYLDAIGRQSKLDPRLIDNLCQCLWRQGKWATLEIWARQNCGSDDGVLQASAYRNLISALEHQGKGDEGLEVRATALALDTLVDDAPKEGDCRPTIPPARDDRRFGRMIHPRTWSA